MEGHAPSEGGDASTSRSPPPRKRTPKRGRHQRRAAVLIDQVFRDSDLLVLVLSQLSSVTQLAHADAVSRHWHEVGRSNMVWKGFLATAFPGAEAFAGVSSFRAVYARMRGIDPSAQRPRSKLSDYQFLVNFRYTPGDATGDDRVLASLCISEVAQPDSEDKVLYYDDLEERDGDSESGDSEDGDSEDGDAHEGEGDDSGDDSEDVGEGDSDEVDSDEDDSDEDDEDDEDDQDDEDEEAMQEEAEALAETVKDQPPFHLRQWIDIPTLDWLWNALAELVGAQVGAEEAEAMQLRLGGGGQSDAGVLQQAVTLLTECVKDAESVAATALNLEVSAFRVRDQRVVRLASAMLMEDYVGLHEMSFEGIEPPASGRHRRRADVDYDAQEMDSLNFCASLRPAYDPEQKRVRWIFGLRLACAMHAIGNVEMTLPHDEFLYALERVAWV